jgi:hypothetical protein
VTEVPIKRLVFGLGVLVSGASAATAQERFTKGIPSTSRPVAPSGLTGMDERSASYAVHSRGEFNVENNDWGAKTLSTYRQSIYATPTGVSPPRFAWKWDYPAERPNDVKAYPEIIYGKKPWADRTTASGLPRKVTPVPSLRVDFSLSTLATGRYNATFEIWLTNAPGAAGERSISHEIMFWIGHQGSPIPAGTFDRDVTLADGRVCGLWRGRMNTWGYTAFVFKEPITTGVIEFGYYLNYLLERGLIPANHYIASLEFGNEIWHGAGTTSLERYSVSVVANLTVPPAPSGVKTQIVRPQTYAPPAAPPTRPPRPLSEAMNGTSVMPQNNQRRVRRRTPRVGAAATYWTSPSSSEPGRAARLHDLSEDGLRLVVGRALARGSKIEVKFESPDSGCPVVRMAVIVWCATRGEATLAGARFLIPMNEDELARLT